MASNYVRLQPQNFKEGAHHISLSVSVVNITVIKKDGKNKAILENKKVYISLSKYAKEVRISVMCFLNTLFFSLQKLFKC